LKSDAIKLARIAVAVMNYAMLPREWLRQADLNDRRVASLWDLQATLGTPPRVDLAKSPVKNCSPAPFLSCQQNCRSTSNRVLVRVLMNWAPKSGLRPIAALHRLYKILELSRRSRNLLRRVPRIQSVLAMSENRR
jgi:hypothetical protein